MDTTKILAFDQATATGWAFGDDRDPRAYVFGHFHLPKRPYIGERLAYQREQVIVLIDRFQPDLIAIEEPFFPWQGAFGKDDDFQMSQDTLKFLQMVKGVVMEAAASRAIPVEAYPSASWRVTAVGYGRKPKGADDDHMKRAMVAKAASLGYKVAIHDEADAIGILLHAAHGPPGQDRRQGDLLAAAGATL